MSRFITIPIRQIRGGTQLPNYSNSITLNMSDIVSVRQITSAETGVTYDGCSLIYKTHCKGIRADATVVPRLSYKEMIKQLGSNVVKEDESGRYEMPLHNVTKVDIKNTLLKNYAVVATRTSPSANNPFGFQYEEVPNFFVKARGRQEAHKKANKILGASGKVIDLQEYLEQ